MRRRLIAMLLTGIVYAGLYLASVHPLSHLYTPEWTARNVLLPAAVVSILPLFRGYYRLAACTTMGYALGVLTGELFGGFQSDVPPRYVHHGWWIWGVVFLLSVAVGVIVEVRSHSASAQPQPPLGSSAQSSDEN